MSPRPRAQGHRELMTQHQDLGVLPPRLPPRQAQHRHGPGDDEEDRLQAHKPKIIARPTRTRPARRHRSRDRADGVPQGIGPGSAGFRHSHRVRSRYPGTPVAELKLLPSVIRNPHGRKAISAVSLGDTNRIWVDAMPEIRLDDGTAFDKSKIFLYAYRHTKAQRHADAGVAVDVLAMLLDHDTLEATRGYHRVKVSGIASAGRETAGQQVTGSPERRSDRPDASPVTWEDPASIPSDE